MSPKSNATDGLTSHEGVELVHKAASRVVARISYTYSAYLIAAIRT